MAEILFVICHITDVIKKVLVVSPLIIFQDKWISVSLCLQRSVSSAHIGFGHHIPHNQYLLPFITTLHSLRKTCFDTNICHVCHMTACIIFVGMFVVIVSVSYVVWFSRYIYRVRQKSIHTL